MTYPRSYRCTVEKQSSSQAVEFQSLLREAGGTETQRHSTSSHCQAMVVRHSIIHSRTREFLEQAVKELGERKKF